MPFIIAIVGTSGSGKTTLANHLQTLAPDNICLLSLDNYFIGKKPEETLEEYSNRNFDEPKALNLKLFCSDLAKLKQGLTIKTPFYDMKNDFTSYPECIEIIPKPVIIIEGTMLFTKPELINLIDFKVFLKVPTGIALSRRLTRDVKERNIDIANSLYRYERDIFPSYKDYIKPYKYNADLTIGVSNESKIGNYPKEAMDILKNCIFNAIENNKETQSANINNGL